MKTETPLNPIGRLLRRNGFVREMNGGGTHVWTKPCGLWVMSVCNGSADEPGAYDIRVHINAHWHDDCEKFIPGFFVRVQKLTEALTGLEMIVQSLSTEQES